MTQKTKWEITVQLKEENVSETYSVQQVDAALQLTPTIQSEIKVMAGLLGIDWRKLLACVIRQVGIVKLVRCIIAVASGSGDFWSCLGAIDWEGVVACAGEAVPAPATPAPSQGYVPNQQSRC